MVYTREVASEDDTDDGGDSSIRGKSVLTVVFLPGGDKAWIIVGWNISGLSPDSQLLRRAMPRDTVDQSAFCQGDPAKRDKRQLTATERKSPE